MRLEMGVCRSNASYRSWRVVMHEYVLSCRCWRLVMHEYVLSCFSERVLKWEHAMRCVGLGVLLCTNTSCLVLFFVLKWERAIGMRLVGVGV